MSEIKDRQDAVSDIDPNVAAPADDTPNDTRAAAAVEGLGYSDELIDVAEESNGVPPTEGMVVDDAGGAESEVADNDVVDNGDADFDRVAAVAADAVASVLSAAPEAESLAADTEFSDATLASQAMPAELAAELDVSTDDSVAPAEDLSDHLGAVVLPVVRIPGMTEAAPFEHTSATYADTVVELEAPVDQFSGDEEGPLLDGELEDGIASVFAALHAAAMDGAIPPIEPLGDLEAAEGVTFRLLGELDRLWHRAA
jgi:hypothetical protein